MIIIKYLSMYMCLGMIAMVATIIGGIVYAMYKSGWDYKLCDAAFDQISDSNASWDDPMVYATLLLLWVVWPMSVILLMNLFEIVLDYIDEHLKTKTES